MEQQFVEIHMDDGTVWQVPAEIIAQHRAETRARDKCRKEGDQTNFRAIYDEVYAETLAKIQILPDWLRFCMCWDDIKEDAVHVRSNPRPAPNYHEMLRVAGMTVIASPE